MTDIVVTISEQRWLRWLQGPPPLAVPGAAAVCRGATRTFTLFGPEFVPAQIGDRLYVAAAGRLRLRFMTEAVRHTAVSTRLAASLIGPVTLDESVAGFSGWRERWWDATQERDFPGWAELAAAAGAPAPLPDYAHGKSRSEQAGSSA